jgi:hypothetical protein
VLNYPASDLIDVLIGKKSFQQALESSPKPEPKRTTEIATGRPQTNSDEVLKQTSSA